MPDATYFARKARRCRELLNVARVPEVEFEAEARKSAERKERKRQGASVLRRHSRPDFVLTNSGREQFCARQQTERGLT